MLLGFVPVLCVWFIVAGVMGLKCEVSWENNEIAINKLKKKKTHTQEEEEIVPRRSSVGFVLACASEKYVYHGSIPVLSREPFKDALILLYYHL